MKRTKIIFLTALVLCAALALFCGCGQRYPITVDCSDLPEGYELHMLLKLDNEENSELNEEFGYSDEPYVDENLKRSEIYNYSENGWKCADIYLNSVEAYGSEFNFYTDEKRSWLAKGYKTFKLAICSEDGDMYKLSNEVVMQYDGKYAFYTEYSYNYESNTLTPTGGIEYYRNENGQTPKDYESDLIILTVISCIFFIHLLFTMKIVWTAEKNHRSKVFIVVGSVFSLPYLALIVYQAVLYFVPYYDISGETFFGKLLTLVVMSIWFLIQVLFFVLVYIQEPRPPKQEEEAKYVPKKTVAIVFAVMAVAVWVYYKLLDSGVL